jgi:hypothetical protein
LLEDAIFAPAEFFDVRVGTVPEKMAKDVAALAAIEDEIEFRVGDLPAQGVEKLAPGFAMGGVTIDEDAIHVEDNAAEVARAGGGGRHFF